MSSPLHDLDRAGVSIWLDDLSRDRIQSGSLAELITSRAVSGVTTNPTIFAGAFSKGDAYKDQLTELSSKGASAPEAVFEATTQDVRMACDAFADIGTGFFPLAFFDINLPKRHVCFVHRERSVE
jgi:transaldolase